MRSPTFTRVVLLLLAIPQLVTGTWAVLAPRGFYDRFPGPGSPWVAVDGPFNLHLVTDAGAGFLAVGVVLAIAALWLRRPLVVGALAASVAHGIPHAAYHLRAPAEALSTPEQLSSTVPLVIGVLAAVALLVAWLRPDTSAAPGPLAAPAAPTAPGDVAALDDPPRGLLVRVLFAAARRRLGVVPTSWRALARQPRVLLARAVGDATHATTRVVPARLGALATLRVATLVECAFCTDILAAEAWGEGLREEQLRDLTRWRESTVFDADERLVLAFAEALTLTPTVVEGGLRGELVERFGEDGMIELAAVIGHENTRARVNRALGVVPQGFAAAAGCPLPEVARA